MTDAAMDLCIERIQKDIRRFESHLEGMDNKRRRVRREADLIAYHRREADYQGKIRGLKYALEHIKVSRQMTGEK